MKIDSQSDNLISFPIGGDKKSYDPNEVSPFISHPASKNFPEEADDLIESMLSEGEKADGLSAGSSSKIYIHEKENKLQEFISRDDSLIFTSHLVSAKLNKINEYTKRIKYYLEDLEDLI